MPGDWSRTEVEATVADYLEMLDDELAGREYNKTEHRRGLSKLLNNRTDAAIERKHQNVSAALIELGLPYVNGYKPLGNYQQLLFDVVQDRVSAMMQLLGKIREDVTRPAVVPTVDDILASLMQPPRPVEQKGSYQRRLKERPTPRLNVNYLEIEAANRSLGRAGEEFVVRYEKARLIATGKERLASKVEHVALTRGDGLGYDILSFDDSERERLVEVKTTSYGQHTPFLVTSNEVRVSHEHSGQYHTYRVFDFRKLPKLFHKQGAIAQQFALEPRQYAARIA